MGVLFLGVSVPLLLGCSFVSLACFLGGFPFVLFFVFSVGSFVVVLVPGCSSGSPSSVCFSLVCFCFASSDLYEFSFIELIQGKNMLII